MAAAPVPANSTPPAPSSHAAILGGDDDADFPHEAVPRPKNKTESASAAPKVHVWDTPEMLKSKMPPGFRIYLHTSAKHWRIQRTADRRGKIFGFGKSVGIDYLKAADMALDAAWQKAGKMLRPLECFWDDQEKDAAGPILHEVNPWRRFL